MLAGVLCCPWLRDRGPHIRAAPACSGVLWLSMLPVIAVYGFRA
jgi:hypothetical protein